MSSDAASVLFHVATLESRLERVEKALAALDPAHVPVFTAAEMSALVAAVRGGQVPPASAAQIPGQPTH
jgi:hypothetical protein